MTTGKTSQTFTMQKTVAFGDCDPGGIVHTPRVFDYCMDAIDQFWKTLLDGKGFYELVVDHDRRTPFVNVNMNFISPITPREVLEITVSLAKVGRTSVTFEVAAAQSGRACFKGTLSSVLVERETMTKVAEDDWTIASVRAFNEGSQSGGKPDPDRA